MDRRPLLLSLGLSFTLGTVGCASIVPDDDGDSTPNSTNEIDTTDGSNEDDALEGPGGPMIEVHGFIVDEVPEDEEVISSDDDRLNGSIFREVFLEIDEAGEEKNDEELVGEVFSAVENRETDEGKAAMDAKAKLPVTEQTIGDWGKETGVYVEHCEHEHFLFFRIYHLD